MSDDLHRLLGGVRYGGYGCRRLYDTKVVVRVVGYVALVAVAGGESPAVCSVSLVALRIGDCISALAEGVGASLLVIMHAFLIVEPVRVYALEGVVLKEQRSAERVSPVPERNGNAVAFSGVAI